MNYTIKGSITAKKNKSGLYPLSLRYTINGIPSNISLKGTDGKVICIDKNDFDTSAGLMKKTKSNFNALNALIRTHTQILEDVASASILKDFPTIKKLYLEKLDQIKIDEEASELHRKKVEIAGKAKRLVTRFNAEEAKEKKETLTKSLTEINAELDRYRAEGVINTVDEEEIEFKKLLLDFPRKYAVDKPRTEQQYKSWAGNLIEFSQITNTPLLFSQLDFEFYNKLFKYFTSERIGNKKKMLNSTFGGQVKKLKQFVGWCRKYNGVKNVNLIYEDFPVIRQSKESKIYLEDAELDLLYNEFRPTVSDSQQKLIDLTVFQCAVGLRFGDIYASAWAVKEINGKKYLTGETEKNNGIYVIPFDLDKRIEEILDRYNYRMRFMVKQVYNREIKTLLKKFFDHFQLNQLPITYTERRFDQKNEIPEFKHNLIASHSNRRRFINHWKLQGFEDQTILDMLGSKDSVVLQDYKKKDIINTSTVLRNKLEQIRLLVTLKDKTVV